MRTLLLAILVVPFLSCVAKFSPPLINERIFEPSKYKCSAGNLDLSDYVLVGDSLFLSRIRDVMFCLDNGIIDGSSLDIPENQSKVINAAQVGMTCEDGKLISSEFVLVHRLMLYKLTRSLELCVASFYQRDPPPEKKKI